MKTQDERYGDRLKRGPSASTVFVRSLVTVGMLLLTGIAVMLHLNTQAYSRSQTAYYHLADILVTGGELEYDKGDEEGGYIIETPENLGLSASGWWRTTATVKSDRWIFAKTELCQPLFLKLGIEITASFPEKGMT